MPSIARATISKKYFADVHQHIETMLSGPVVNASKHAMTSVRNATARLSELPALSVRTLCTYMNALLS